MLTDHATSTLWLGHADGQVTGFDLRAPGECILPGQFTSTPFQVSQSSHRPAHSCELALLFKTVQACGMTLAAAAVPGTSILQHFSDFCLLSTPLLDLLWPCAADLRPLAKQFWGMKCRWHRSHAQPLLSTSIAQAAEAARLRVAGPLFCHHLPR